MKALGFLLLRRKLRPLLPSRYPSVSGREDHGTRSWAAGFPTVHSTPSIAVGSSTVHLSVPVLRRANRRRFPTGRPSYARTFRGTPRGKPSEIFDRGGSVTDKRFRPGRCLKGEGLATRPSPGLGCPANDFDTPPGSTAIEQILASRDQGLTKPKVSATGTT